jgi:hypothetical protein
VQAAADAQVHLDDHDEAPGTQHHVIQLHGARRVEVDQHAGEVDQLQLADAGEAAEALDPSVQRVHVQRLLQARLQEEAQHLAVDVPDLQSVQFLEESPIDDRDKGHADKCTGPLTYTSDRLYRIHRASGYCRGADPSAERSAPGVASCQPNDESNSYLSSPKEPDRT